MKKFNIEEFFTFIVLLGFSTLFYYLIFTGKIKTFISPKMISYMMFALIMFTILTFYQGNKVFSPKNHKSISSSYILLLLTLIIGFASAEKGINLAISENKTINLPSYAKRDKLKIPSSNSKDEKVSENRLKENLSLTKGNTIAIDDSNFYKAVNDIGTNLEKYRSKKVIITGFVFKREDFKEDEFVVGRMSMACCAADAQVMGLMAKWAEAKNLEKDIWVNIEGVIQSTQYSASENNETFTLPLIEVTKVEKIQTPENIYVYPDINK